MKKKNSSLKKAAKKLAAFVFLSSKGVGIKVTLQIKKVLPEPKALEALIKNRVY